MTEQTDETDEQRADREETERDHARGDHTHCGITCETEMPTEHLRNFVIAKGYPGTAGALAELERRAAAKAVLPATTETAHGLSVQHADALWDAVAVPGPDRPTYPQQHQRVCRAVREILDETAATETHACDNCEGVDPDTCFKNPHRPPEQCPRSEADGYGLQCQKPAGHNLCTFEEQATPGAHQ